MKKVAFVFVVLLSCAILSGCFVYRSINGVLVQGKDVDCQYNQFTQTFVMKGASLQATILRQSAIAPEKTAANMSWIFNLPNVEEGDLYFEITQNFKPVTAIMEVR